jgi:Protein of unknown function (DUF1631)
MSLSTTHQHAALTAAAQRLKDAFRDCVEGLPEVLTGASGAVVPGTSLDDARTAAFELDRKRPALVSAFAQSLDESIDTEWRRRQNARTGGATTMMASWEGLSLMDDAQIERQVAGDRLGGTLRTGCEAELQLLDAYIGGLVPSSNRPDADRNPLRPDVVGKALVSGVEAITDNDAVRKVLLAQAARSLRVKLAQVYRDIADALHAAGVEPLQMTVRNVQSATSGDSVHDSRTQALGGDTGSGALLPGGGSGPTTSHGSTHGSAHGALGPSTASPRSATTMGQVNQEVMTLIRRLAAIGHVTVADGLGPSSAAAPLTNLIATHRDELRSATSNALDHMVIDVVGSLFDQILADPKVPPQMARHIARLQLPVLRAALGDPTFFSSRRHPVRRFVNRIASLSIAFDDFNEAGAKRFLELVRELVDQIVSGDFDQMQVYEDKLDRLEAFIAEQAQRDAEAPQSPGALLNQRERELLQLQRYMQQLHAGLLQVPMDDFLRQFLTQVWSQAIIQANAVHGEHGEATNRYRGVARDLVLSVQPKGTPSERKRFLMLLPQLMKDLNEGLASIGWSDAATKAFMSRLLPAHAESLKRKSMSVLDFNMLAKQLDAVMAVPVPRQAEASLFTGQSLPVNDDAIVPHLAPDEVRRIGLVREASVDWDGKVDIDLGDEPDAASGVDIEIDIEGLPAMKEPAEPTQGAQLADHVQIGFSYRMFFEHAWHKVRLSHVSPGRTFFVFTRGKDHGEAISMTARMLFRLCEAGRLRAYENAYLIERATARARRQLAALNVGSASA